MELLPIQPWRVAFMGMTNCRKGPPSLNRMPLMDPLWAVGVVFFKVNVSFIISVRALTWFPTRRRQVPACRSNLVADGFRPYSITLSWSLAGLRPAKLDSEMEFGLRHEHDVHTQVFVQLASSSRTSSRAGRRPASELVASWIV